MSILVEDVLLEVTAIVRQKGPYVTVEFFAHERRRVEFVMAKYDADSLRVGDLVRVKLEKVST